MALKLAAVATVQPTTFEAVAARENLEENVRLIRDLGYDGVELAVRDPSQVDVDAIASLVSECALVVPAIGTGQAYIEEGLSFTDADPQIRRNAVDRIKHHVEFAKNFGAKVIIGLIRGTCAQRDEQREALKRVGDCLLECASYGAQHGVALVLEPLNRYETSLLNNFRQTIEFLDDIAAENIGILADSFHMNIEEPSIAESLRFAGERIAHVHVADSNREAPGRGHIDFAEFVTTLTTIGYDGFYSAEILPVPDGDTAIADAITLMRSL
jgi:sugar phosphate isomerase/epimerase